MKRQRLTSLSCVMLGSLLTSQLAVAGDVEPLSKLQLMDVFELEYAADPRISPDGKRVAYLRTGMYFAPTLVAGWYPHRLCHQCYR